MDCETGAVRDFRPDLSSEKLPPCSTFKIWNTLIGFEIGALSSPDDPFYKWDGVTRGIPEWNKDLSLRDAFRVSCVPAFQNLAWTIGSARMREWLDKIGYGDRDMSAGVDLFWLPAPGRKTVLITPREQAALICKLLSGTLPFSEKSRAALQSVMAAKKTSHGTLYGKTGSGADGAGVYTLGWFVGYVEHDGKAYAFACTVKGAGAMGKDARAIVEAVLDAQGLL